MLTSIRTNLVIEAHGGHLFFKLDILQTRVTKALSKLSLTSQLTVFFSIGDFVTIPTPLHCAGVSSLEAAATPLLPVRVLLRDQECRRDEQHRTRRGTGTQAEQACRSDSQRRSTFLELSPGPRTRCLFHARFPRSGIPQTTVFFASPR